MSLYSLCVESMYLIDCVHRCIEAMAKFVTPFLDMLGEATGWKVSLFAGGPEPADDGRLNLIRYVSFLFLRVFRKPTFHCSVHSGTTKGDVPMNFAAAERASYKEMLVPIFADFLRKCYSELLPLVSTYTVLNVGQALMTVEIVHSRNRMALCRYQHLPWSWMVSGWIQLPSVTTRYPCRLPKLPLPTHQLFYHRRLLWLRLRKNQPPCLTLTTRHWNLRT